MKFNLVAVLIALFTSSSTVLIDESKCCLQLIGITIQPIFSVNVWIVIRDQTIEPPHLQFQLAFW